jgi:hypothetical protein
MRPDAVGEEFVNSDIDSIPVFLLEAVYVDEGNVGGRSGLVL